MANTLASPTMGFQAFQRMDGGSPTAGMTPLWIASTDTNVYFRGDVVATSSASGSNNSGAYLNPTISSTAVVRGIFQGCYQYQPAAGRVVWSNYYNGAVTGSTGDIKAYVIDDPGELFLAQCSTATTFLSSQIGVNIGFSSGVGNTASGYSNYVLNPSNTGSTASLPFRVVDFYSAYAVPAGFAGPAGAGTSPWINGTDNTSPGNMLIVRLNNCDRLNLTARST